MRCSMSSPRCRRSLPLEPVLFPLVRVDAAPRLEVVSSMMLDEPGHTFLTAPMQCGS